MKRPIRSLRFVRRARREDLGLNAREFATLAKLTTPVRIQAFISTIPANFEPDGETVHSVRSVLRLRRAHCIEGALVAACALWIHGEPPLVVHLGCAPHDHPHVVAAFRRGRCWGAISKSNGTWLRYREPVYRSLRELAMSYFHEFFDSRGRKTLRSLGDAYDLRRVPVAEWVSCVDSCWPLHDRLAALRHRPLLSDAQIEILSRRDTHERRATLLVEHARPGNAQRRRA